MSIGSPTRHIVVMTAAKKGQQLESLTARGARSEGRMQLKSCL